MPTCKYCHREIWRPARDTVILEGRDWFCNRSHQKSHRAGKIALRRTFRRWLGFWVGAILLQTANMIASAHPPDARHADWFMSQTNQNGMSCCDLSDGHTLSDVDWRTTGNNYEVRIDGEWHKILPHQIAKGSPNPTGASALWFTRISGKVHVYCFSPGTLY